MLAATHRNLELMVAKGSFREDLNYRLKGMILRTFSLDERATDIPQLAARFLRQSTGNLRLDTTAFNYLPGRRWPGNVRELRSVIDSAAALAATGTIDADLLRFAAGEAPFESAAETQMPPGSLDAAIAELETRLLRETLAATVGNQSEAARRLGLSRVGLAKKLNRLGLKQ